MLSVSAGQMKEIDRRTIEEFGIPGRVLMENAGRAVADEVLHYLYFYKQLRQACN